MNKLLTLICASSFALNVHAALQIDETFDVETDFTNYWVDDTTNGDYVFTASGLSYAGWGSSGGAVQDASSQQSDNGTRGILLDNVNVTLVDNQTYWGGFLMRIDAASSAGRGFGFAQNGPFRVLFNFGSTGDGTLLPGTRNDGSDPANGELDGGAVGASALTVGQTNLVLFKLSSNSGADQVEFWLNPDLSSGESSIGAATWTAGAALGNDLDGKLNDWWFRSSAGGQTTYDELRFGDTFAEVAAVPEPSAYGLMVGALAFVWGVMRGRR